MKMDDIFQGILISFFCILAGCASICMIALTVSVIKGEPIEKSGTENEIKIR